jgi:hypothetical protein
MDSNLFAKLSKTKLVEVADEVVRAFPRGLSDTEIVSVAGGAQLAAVAGGAATAGLKIKEITFTIGPTVTNSTSGGVQDDCLD